MKPPIEIQTTCEDKTEFENFVEFTKKLLKVPKVEIDKRIIEHKKKSKRGKKISNQNNR